MPDPKNAPDPASPPRIAALDVAYSAESARSAAVVFTDWRGDRILESAVVEVAAAAPYQPGAFYQRELPALLATLKALEAPPATLLVDGYVRLGAEGRPGLGLRLWEALEGRAAVIGVAKNPYPGAPEETTLLRGDSRKPLFVTAAGLPLAEAKARIREMHGAHRLPTLLKAVDRLSRGAPSGA